MIWICIVWDFSCRPKVGCSSKVAKSRENCSVWALDLRQTRSTLVKVYGLVVCVAASSPSFF